MGLFLTAAAVVEFPVVSSDDWGIICRPWEPGTSRQAVPWVGDVLKANGRWFGCLELENSLTLSASGVPW